jgi:serine phosphatase RsbU (regulator of sigma subunit)
LARWERATRREAASSTRTQGAIPAGPFPPFPTLPDLEIHAADITSRLATGDFCDFFFLSSSELAVVMADVSGKGVPAAVLRGVTRSVLRNLASAEVSPGATLTRLNRILCEADLGSMFLTLYLGQYRVSTGLLRYANAGHPLPYRMGRDDAVQAWGEVTGPILGILESSTYADREEYLAPGDGMLLLTDGVTEARSPAGEFFATKELPRCLEASVRLPLDVLCRVLGEKVRAFQGGAFQDDATVLALRRSG